MTCFFCVICLYFSTADNLCVFVWSSGESEPGDRQRVRGGGRDGDHQLSGEEQRRLRHPAA